MRRRLAVFAGLLVLAAGLTGAGCAVPTLGRPKAQDLTPAVDRVEAEINSALLRRGVSPAEVRAGGRAESRLAKTANARWTHRSFTLVAQPTFCDLTPADYAAAVREGARRAGARVREVGKAESGAASAPAVRLTVELPVRVGRQSLIIEALEITIVPPGAAGRAGAGEEGAGERESLGPEPEPQESGDPPRVALIIDDWGYEQVVAWDFLALPVPLTMAVIPFLPASERLARAGHAHGWEILVHLPMEPESARLGQEEGMLRVDMTEEELRQAVQEALAAVPFAAGVNNHKGSRATRDPRVMRVVLGELAARGFFFVDSRTSPSSVAGRIAREQGLAYGENLLFLDGQPDVGYIRQNLQALVQAAERNGYAIGIGHVRKETLSALQTELPLLLQRGVVFTPVQQLVRPDFRYRWWPAVRPPRVPPRPPATAPTPSPPPVQPAAPAPPAPAPEPA
ncbi:MAG: divergent polysaccharide deacetylase family protein, partial [Bacillota bacterium]|nr:divergent polysaccharide deacetylase family protein [Bacillota bacterium]